MGTNSPGGRIARGDAVIEAGKTVDLSPIKARYDVFAAVHKKYVAADNVVKSASGDVETQEVAIGTADAAQDAAVDALAASLAGDGMPRINPLKPLGFVSPSQLRAMGYGAEAKEALRLVGAVGRFARASAGTQAQAKTLGKAARAVQAALAALVPLLKTRTDAMTRRDALAQPWESAYAALRLAAQNAEVDGHKGLSSILFPVQKRRAPRPAPPASGPPPTGTTPPTIATTARKKRRKRR